MNARLKQFCIDTLGVAKEAEDAVFKAAVAENLKSGKLDADKYAELLSPVAPTKDRGDELAEKTAAAVTSAMAPAFAGIATALEGLGKAFVASKPEPPKAPVTEPTPADDVAELKRMNEELIKKFGLNNLGNDGATASGAALMAMSKSVDDSEPGFLRVKSAVESFAHNPQTLVYKNQGHAKLLGIGGDPILYGAQTVDMATERTKAMDAVWMKLQMFPESLNEREKGIVRYILHREKFFLPSSDPTKTSARLLTEAERHEVLKGHMEFYKAAVVNDTGTGGEYATPQFFDMDMIVAPTLAQSENIAAYCHVIPVPRGAAAQNFVLGRPTISAANETVTSGTPTAVFSPTGFITNHDTTFFRAAGFIELGRNFVEDAHPGLVAEIQQQYMNSVRLWFNEQIMNGDGTTEPQGVKNASGTADITPTNPTAGPVTLSDVFRALFGVGKAFREDGGRGNAIYVMTDTTYSRIRAIATGVTGDTRLVFGEDVESYRLFGHPVLIEQQGMDNGDLVFMQAKGYRLYLRQGPRFIREDRGDTLVRRNTFLVGVDVRAGGQLDLGQYAACADSLLVT